MKGTLLGGYRILSELGSGGMGKVYLAEVAVPAAGLSVGTPVALKVIHPNLLETPGFFKRFLREAQIGQEVTADNVVRTFDCDATLVDGQQHNFLVMEYVEGQTLRALLKELERVPEELCRHIGREVAKGLAAIHEVGVIHRDIKPENVLITEEHVVKVMDLGVARLQDEAMRLSQAGAFVGSLEYAAPEQFRGTDGEPDGRTDLHSLGVVLYELSTGQHPYRDENASKVLRNILDVEPRKAGEVNPQLSAFFEEVVHTLLAKDPAQRFPNAADLALVLDEGEKSDWWKERAKALRLETKRPLRRIRIPRETALYGRDDDLAKLHGLYEKAKAGEGQVLLIEGEAGIGKSRLVDEFVGRLRQDGEDINFLFGSYPPGGAATASGAFSEAYREQFGAEGLEEALSSYLTTTPVLIPAFAALLRGDSTPTGAQPLTKDSLQTVFVHATRAMAKERTTIVLIDDLHFAPEDGRALFSSLAMAVPGHRILLLGTMRPGVPEDWIANVERLEHAWRTVLARLGPKDLFSLLKDSFRSDRLAKELGLQISVKSDGNPFFAFEIIRGLREGQFISQKPDGTWVTTRVIEDIQIPSSVMDLIQARLSDLDEEERDLLDVASCCGFDFDPLLVAETLGLARVPALRRLARIEARHRLVRSAGEHFRFDHHQVQESIYRALSVPLAREYHTAMAEALAARAGAADKDAKDLDGSVCVDLCEHFLKGAQSEKALRYLDAALDYLGNGFLNDRAITLADRALDVEGLLTGSVRFDVLLKKNERLDLLGRRAEQEAVLAEARGLAEEEGEMASLAKVERAAGILLWKTGFPQQAKAHHEQALAIAREVGDRALEGNVLGNLGNLHWSQGRMVDARLAFDQALSIARELGNRGSEGSVLGNLGILHTGQGRMAEAREHYEQALSIHREVGDRAFEATVLGNLGNLHQDQGRMEEALLHYEQALSIDREVGNRRLEGSVLGNLGLLHMGQGRMEQAREHFKQALSIDREVGDRRLEGAVLGNLGLLHRGQGRMAEAREHFEQALSIHREVGDRAFEATVLGSLGNLHMGQGRMAEARAHFEQALSIAREVGDRAFEGIVLGNLGTLHLGQGRMAEARAAFDAGEALLRAVEHLDEVGQLLCGRVPLEKAQGHEEAARAALVEAEALADKLGAGPDSELGQEIAKARAALEA